MSEPAQAATMDPVCGMTVNPDDAPSHEHVGEIFYFCSRHCRDKFATDPEAVLNPPEEAEADTSTGSYTCPMHPEIVQDHPGDCPKCGMALEPMTVGGEEDDPELKAMTRRFWTSVPLSSGVLLLAMGELVPALSMREFFGAAFGWIQALLATPVVLWCGWFAFVRGYKSIVNVRPNMWTLISIGVGAAYAFSVVALLIPDLLPAAFKSEAGHVPIYFEVAAVIVTLVLLGQVMEARARATRFRWTANSWKAAPASTNR